MTLDLYLVLLKNHQLVELHAKSSLTILTCSFVKIAFWVDNGSTVCLLALLLLFFDEFYLPYSEQSKDHEEKKVQKNSERNFPMTLFEKDTAPSLRPWAQDREEHIFLGKKKRRIHIRIGFPYRVKRLGAYVRFDIF